MEDMVTLRRHIVKRIAYSRPGLEWSPALVRFPQAYCYCLWYFSPLQVDFLTPKVPRRSAAKIDSRCEKHQRQ